MYYTLYKITNKINHRIYVGTHVTDNLDDDYLGSGKLIIRAIKKYGKENFKKEYLHIFDNPEHMFEAESLIVNEEFISNADTYNLVEGGKGGWSHVNNNELGVRTFEMVSKKRLKEISRLGNKARNIKMENDPEAKELWLKRMSQSNKGQPGVFSGKHHTKEAKDRIGKANSKHQAGSKNSQYGTCWIYSITEQQSIKIKKEQMKFWIEQGWIRGRKIKF